MAVEQRSPNTVCQAALIIRRLRSRVEARPYPWRLSNFTLVTVPSTCPVDQGSVNLVVTTPTVAAPIPLRPLVESRVERITQRVAHGIQAERDQEDGHAGHGRHVRGYR